MKSRNIFTFIFAAPRQTKPKFLVMFPHRRILAEKGGFKNHLGILNRPKSISCQNLCLDENTSRHRLGLCFKGFGAVYA
jgi:hypothetical protein